MSSKGDKPNRPVVLLDPSELLGLSHAVQSMDAGSPPTMRDFSRAFSKIGEVIVRDLGRALNKISEGP